jgi:hypothetical protein
MIDRNPRASLAVRGLSVPASPCYSQRMDKPIALDICCRKGGATVGLQRAGFHVIGVDIEPQPGYPGDDFIEMDGLELLSDLPNSAAHAFSLSLGTFVRPALIWESWQGQEGNTATASNRARGIKDDHEQFIPRARELSDKIGIPYVLEQPASSRKGLIRRDLTLCMDTFKGDMPPPWVQKHRSFELGRWPDLRMQGQRESLPPQPPHRKHAGYVRGYRHGVNRTGPTAPYVAGYGDGGGKATAAELRHAMGIDWMTDRFDLCEAIPPAYSEYIGRHFLAGR